MEIKNWPIIEAISIIYTVDLFNCLYWFYISGWAFSGVTYLVSFFLPLTILSVLAVAVLAWIRRKDNAGLSKTEWWATATFGFVFLLKIIIWGTYPL